jgi:acetyl-CoA C-acetyltransferase
MAERIGIVAVAQTKYQPDRSEVNEGELVYETIGQVLKETGLKYADALNDDGSGIDSIVTCSSDAWDGRTISGMGVMSYIGSHLSTEDKIAMDSLNAVYCAYGQLLSHHHNIVSVVAHCKESMADRGIVESIAFDPVYMRPFNLDFRAAAALQARRYMHKYGITAEQCAKVAVKNRKNAKNNPFAQEPMDITVEDVLNSEMLVDPIRRLDTKPTSDGSCTLIMAREDKVRELTDKPVWITGISNCTDSHLLGDRELADCDALAEAAKRAYEMAGIKDPLKEFDVAEISGDYSYQELLWMEGLGLCGRGEAGKLIDDGVTEMGGQLPVNPSGGMLAGNPTYVAGAARVAEAFLQLRGEAGDRQVEGACTALVHGVTGICGQHHCVAVLSNK